MTATPTAILTPRSDPGPSAHTCVDYACVRIFPHHLWSGSTIDQHLWSRYFVDKNAKMWYNICTVNRVCGEFDDDG